MLSFGQEAQPPSSFVSLGDDEWERVAAVERRPLCCNLCAVILQQKNRQAADDSWGRDVRQDKEHQ